MYIFLNFILHIDKYLGPIIQNYGSWTYGLLSLVIFLETGLVIMPFLPGDSLLFAAGAFAGRGFLNPIWLWLFLSLAAIFGDSVNYWAGRRIGQRIFATNRPLINEEYLKRTQNFYQKHGKKTLILARFIPIIRTFAPFIAGVGNMEYPIFISYNIIGGAVWIALFVFGGYFFGNLPVVRDYFSLVILAIIAISIIPAVVEFWKHRSKVTF